MTQDLAAALLRDVPRYEPDNPLDSAPSMKDDPQGDWLSRDAVLAALSRALDPAIAERAGEVLPRLRKADEYEPLGHDGWEAADLITALLTANAALRAERDELAAEVKQADTMLVAEANASLERLARAEAAEAKVAEYETEDGMKGAIVHAIRLLLNSHNVPAAAFIDDHVGNAIAQRDAAEAQNAALTARVEGLRGAGSNLVAQLYQMWTEARDHRDRSDLGSAEYAKRDMMASAFRGAYLAALSATTEEGHE